MLNDLTAATALIPQDDWSPDQLGEYASQQLAASASIESNLATLVRKSVVSYFRAGQALFFARQMLKQTDQWCSWQDKHGLPRTTVFEAIQVYEMAKSEEAIAGITLAEARKKYLGHKKKLVPQTKSRKTFRSGMFTKGTTDPCSIVTMIAGQVHDLLAVKLSASEVIKVRPMIGELIMKLTTLERHLSSQSGQNPEGQPVHSLTLPAGFTVPSAA